jgi:hypothetical protein
MFIEAPNCNACFLHHIGDADAFEAALAKPLGGDPHNSRVRRLLVSL